MKVAVQPNLGPFVRRVGLSVDKNQPGVFTDFDGVLVAVLIQVPLHRAKVHGRVDDV